MPASTIRLSAMPTSPALLRCRVAWRRTRESFPPSTRLLPPPPPRPRSFRVKATSLRLRPTQAPLPAPWRRMPAALPDAAARTTTSTWGRCLAHPPLRASAAAAAVEDMLSPSRRRPPPRRATHSTSVLQDGTRRLQRQGRWAGTSDQARAACQYPPPPSPLQAPLSLYRSATVFVVAPVVGTVWCTCSKACDAFAHATPLTHVHQGRLPLLFSRLLLLDAAH